MLNDLEEVGLKINCINTLQRAVKRVGRAKELQGSEIGKSNVEGYERAQDILEDTLIHVPVLCSCLILSATKSITPDSFCLAYYQTNPEDEYSHVQVMCTRTKKKVAHNWMIMFNLDP